MIKKLFLILILSATLAVPMLAFPTMTAAQECSPGYEDSNPSDGVQLCNALPIFGGRGVTNIPTLIEASFTWLASVIGTLAMVMIIFAGAQMVFSQGDPQAVTKAKASMTYSIYGLILVMFAYVIVSGVQYFLRVQNTGVPGGQTTGGFFMNPLADQDLMGFILSSIINFLGLIGTAAMLYIIISGFRYVTSRGNEEGIKKAKAGLTWAILGLASVIFSYLIITVIVNTLLRSTV